MENEMLRAWNQRSRYRRTTKQNNNPIPRNRKINLNSKRTVPDNPFIKNWKGPTTRWTPALTFKCSRRDNTLYKKQGGFDILKNKI